MMSVPDDSGEEENLFYFESDHLALRGNRDYSNVLRTIAMLEVQRMRVHKQLEDLVLAKKKYLENPDLLLQKLRNNEEIIAPNHISIEKIPEVSCNLEALSTEIVKIKEEPSESSKFQVVRGRVHDETKPETFNQLWSCEEQRRLEQLLIEYPAEPFESRRYTKIAKALGNRTPQQVSSRVQKYFKKLHDAGLPIPGRRPKNRRNHHTKLKNFYRPTTFFPAHNVSVHMPEEDFFIGELSATHSPAPASSTDAGDYHESQLSADERKRLLQMLKKMRDEKRNTPEGYNPDPMAAKCERCQIAAISRTRWRCNTCYCYLNQCSDCLIQQLLTHKFEHLAHDLVEDDEL